MSRYSTEPPAFDDDADFNRRSAIIDQDARNTPMQEDYRLVTHSLSAFCARATSLLREHRYHEYVRFVLNLCYEENYQAFLDPIQHRLDDEDCHHPISGLRDYDSLLAISDDLLVRRSVTCFVIGRHEDVLQKDIHIQTPVRNIAVRISLSYSYSYSYTHLLTCAFHSSMNREAFVMLTFIVSLTSHSVNLVHKHSIVCCF